MDTTGYFLLCVIYGGVGTLLLLVMAVAVLCRVHWFATDHSILNYHVNLDVVEDEGDVEEGTKESAPHVAAQTWRRVELAAPRASPKVRHQKRQRRYRGEGQPA